MGRRSLASERRRQIITATIECMATNGYAGTTLERIADEANMVRGHVRHYAGNREELLTAAARVFFFGDTAIDEDNLDELAAQTPVIPTSSSLAEVLDYLFGAFTASTSENAAASAFITAARTIEPIRRIVLAAYLGMHASLMEILAASCPGADSARTRQSAYGILTVALGATMLNDIDVSQQRIDDARHAAEALVAELAAHTDALTA